MFDAVCSLFQPLKGDDEVPKKAVAVKDNSAKKETDDDEYISPFIAYDDGYQWPDVFSELDEMIENCILIYPLVELRRKARAKELSEEVCKRVLTMPFTHAGIMEVVEKHKDALGDTKFTKEFYVQTLEAARERNIVSPASVVAVDDEFEQEELVYAVEGRVVTKSVVRGSS
jgi:hypothetical protein